MNALTLVYRLLKKFLLLRWFNFLDYLFLLFVSFDYELNKLQFLKNEMLGFQKSKVVRNDPKTLFLFSMDIIHKIPGKLNSRMTSLDIQ